MNILVTGGAGYIGSHTCVALLEAAMLMPVRLKENWTGRPSEILKTCAGMLGGLKKGLSQKLDSIFPPAVVRKDA